MYSHIYIYTYVHIYICVYIYIYVCVCVYTYTYRLYVGEQHLYIYASYVNSHMYIYIYIYLYTRFYMYTCGACQNRGLVTRPGPTSEYISHGGFLVFPKSFWSQKIGVLNPPATYPVTCPVHTSTYVWHSGHCKPTCRPAKPSDTVSLHGCLPRAYFSRF